MRQSLSPLTGIDTSFRNGSQYKSDWVIVFWKWISFQHLGRREPCHPTHHCQHQLHQNSSTRLQSISLENNTQLHPLLFSNWSPFNNLQGLQQCRCKSWRHSGPKVWIWQVIPDAYLNCIPPPWPFVFPLFWVYWYMSSVVWSCDRLCRYKWPPHRKRV